MLRLLALVLLAIAAPAVAQQPFASERISVEVTGTGPDVVLVPGLSSSPRVWDTTVAAVPGHRYHLIHVSGFDGQAPGANATGPVLVPSPRRSRATSPPPISIIQRSSAIRWAAASRSSLPRATRGWSPRVMVVDMMPYLGAMFRRPGSTDEQLEAMAGQVQGMIASGAGDQRRMQISSMVSTMVKTESARGAVIAQSLASDPAVSGQAMHDLIVTNLVPEIGNIHVPLTVLYVVPAGTPLTPEQLDNYYRLSYQAAPQAVLRRIPDSYHFIMFDQPAVFQAAVREFLAAH